LDAVSLSNEVKEKIGFFRAVRMRSESSNAFEVIRFVRSVVRGRLSGWLYGLAIDPSDHFIVIIITKVY
jgi:hypothetical protein